MSRLSTLVQVAASVVLALSGLVLVGILIWPDVGSNLGSDEVLPDNGPPLSWADFTEGELVLGEPNAENALVVYTDYECPFCRVYHHVLREAVDSAGGSLRIVVRLFPLYVLHPNAVMAAVEAHCAARQPRFPEVHDLLTDSIDVVRLWSAEYLAARAGIADVPAFSECVRSEATLPAIAEDVRVGRELRITKLPKVLLSEQRFAAPPGTARILSEIRPPRTTAEQTGLSP